VKCAGNSPDGAIVWTSWLGGQSLAKVESCRLIDLAGDMRRTVVVTGEADTYFSIPAECRIGGAHVRGWIGSDDDGNLIFHHTYY
jgi:hypothetical protein